ncbi:pyridoxal phosphate-dependent aminotransferase [Rhodohalobacter sp. SW132]|uniref:pyridoxal phosphate-dependent aminotransferase n=1 Tax=Rhodohalobacter sp. SW132 TaxID=2293433 RepID=UPI000E240892|nr:pyridoxal phosphate-dependent aminotransferase [Rhodohalobacter sp. SW132]REL38597.1 pyridoxal phosphate-dependent aminotransferase [Rhodohalobacter sp. SW132]
MKPLSKLTEGIHQSDIRSVTARVNAVNGINLGQGICDMPAPDSIKEGAKKAIDQDRSIYAPFGGADPLVDRIVEKVKTFNQTPIQGAENIMVTAGSTGAFATAAFALLNPGDEVIQFEPLYGYHSKLLELRGVKQISLALHSPSWEVDFHKLESLITPKTKAIVLTTPNNPCGKVWSRKELETLLSLLIKHDIYAITDEVYEYMTYDGREHISLASMDGAFERTITLSSFSKTFNMTGWRLGYASGPKEIIGKMGLLNDILYICAPTPLQHGLADGFATESRYYEQLLRDYDKKRTMMCSALESAGFDVPWPEGAYYVLASFRPMADQPGFSNDQTACSTLIDRVGIGSVPGGSFYSNPKDGKYLLRFCFAKKENELKEACRRLEGL